MAACSKCQRALGPMAVRCMYCGTAVAGAPAPATAAKPVVTACPGCTRAVRAPLDQLASCMYCALAFTPTASGPSFATRDSGVSRDTLAILTSQLPSARIWDLVRSVLLARARELVAGEAEQIVTRLVSVLTWPADAGPTWMPLELDEACTLVPRAVLGLTQYGVFREGAGATLLVLLDTKGRGPDGFDRAALNAAGLAADLAFGFGFSMREDDRVKTERRVQLRVDLSPTSGGVELAFAHQIDQERPTAITNAQQAELELRIAGVRSTLASYYLLAAVYGPSCRDTTAFSIVRDAAAKRLATLGCESPPQLLDALCVRMPPAFR